MNSRLNFITSHLICVPSFWTQIMSVQKNTFSQVIQVDVHVQGLYTSYPKTGRDTQKRSSDSWSARSILSGSDTFVEEKIQKFKNVIQCNNRWLFLKTKMKFISVLGRKQGVDIYQQGGATPHCSNVSPEFLLWHFRGDRLSHVERTVHGWHIRLISWRNRDMECARELFCVQVKS